MKIILGVSGGIAAYKAADLCSKLAKAGVSVRVAFSNNAHEFVRPLVFEALSGHAVYQHVLGTSPAYKMEHISWARWADAFVVAPVTANTIAHMAAGMSDSAISTLYLAFLGDVYIAPSMNTAMLEHAATQANLKTLSQRGVKIISPGEGTLACGEIGSGRMAEPLRIMAAMGVDSGNETDFSQMSTSSQSLRPPDKSLEGKTVLITSGPTREFLDPVRFISNPSSGRMGLALANEASRRGARVQFVSGPVDQYLLPRGNSVQVHSVETARDMLAKVQSLKSECDLFIFAAAVGDFRPSQVINRKIKRTGNSITLPLVENPDIAQSVGFSKQPGQIVIGFAAETNDHEANAKEKLTRKHLDAVVVNDIANPEIGFISSENEVRIVTADKEPIVVSKRPKSDVAFEIMETAMGLF